MISNYYDTPAVDFLDYGDHTSMKALFVQAGLMQEENEYHCNDKKQHIPAMQKLA